MCVAGRSISRVGRVWEVGGWAALVSPVDGSTALQLRVAKFTRPQIHFEGWRCFDFSPPRGQLS